MKNTNLKLIYAHDTLCGWCYGFIPALRYFADQHPDVEIEVVPGGLFADASVRPYAEMSDYIKGAEIRLEQITGRKPSTAFHTMINAKKGPIASSEPPSHAVLQMKSLAPGRATEFAHLLQEAHFGEGKDVNDPATYDNLCALHNFPQLDTVAIQNATSADPLVADSFERCLNLRPNGYPTIFVIDKNDRVVDTIPSIYDPNAFVAQFLKIQETQK